jgi:ABC-type multidrug transport system fused ATPase/permease subunit
MGEIFFLFNFPLNIPGSVFYAYGGYFITKFIFDMFFLIDSLITVEVFTKMSPFKESLSLVVFLIILIVGVIKILINKKRRNKTEETSEKKSEKEVEWKDIGKEIKQGFYNLALRFKHASTPKEKAEEKKIEKTEKKKGRKG